MAGDMADFTVPVPFIVDQDDEVISPSLIEEARRLIPGSRLEIVPGADHSVYFEKPDVFNYLVASFFAEE
jgi:pimeloyl-ACP methyl ester carboxylesterase